MAKIQKDFLRAKKQWIVWQNDAILTKKQAFNSTPFFYQADYLQDNSIRIKSKKDKMGKKCPKNPKYMFLKVSKICVGVISYDLSMKLPLSSFFERLR